MTLYLKYLISIVFFVFTFSLSGQQSIQQILNGKGDFETRCQSAESYFTAKHKGIPLSKLTIGEHRDGKYVKYCRWKNFWKDHLNPDGTLADISQNIKNKEVNNASRQSTSNPYEDINWSNISNSNFITTQISLGRTTALAFHPTDANTFYVGAAIGGIWKTTDGGSTYTPLGDELPYLAVSSIVVDQDNPETLYVAVSDHVWYGPSGIGVYKSVDGGATWSETSLEFSFTDNIRIYWMAADPFDASKILVTTSAGLYETTDGFDTVVQINSLDCSEVHFNPVDSDIVYFGTRDGKFYKSTDGGANYTMTANLGSNYLRIAVSDLDEDLVYVTQGNTLHKSTDAGQTFPDQETLPISNAVISFSQVSTNELVIGNFEVYHSLNDGQSFNVITQWLGNNGLPLVHVDQRNIFTNPLQTDLIYICNDGGVYSYDVTSDQFTNLSDGLQITQYYDIATSQSNSSVVSGGSQDNGSMYRDGSETWTDLAPTGDGMITEIDPDNENLIYWEYQNGGMRRFNGSGNTNISPPGENGNGAWITPFRLDPSDSDRLICGYQEVYESFNNGNNWTAISGELAGGNNLSHIAISKSNGERVYAVNRSTLYVKSIKDKVVITYSGYATGSKVYESTDAGDTWTNISGSLPNVPVGAIEIYEDITGAYFIGTDVGVYYRDYQLGDWLEYGSLPHTRVTDIEIQYSDQLLRVGTHGRGVYEADISIVECAATDSDSDGDGTCDTYDLCPYLDDSLIGTACDDGDPNSSGEVYTEDCTCADGMSNITTCAAAGSAGTGADYITNITVHDLNNTSVQSGYSDFRNLSATLTDDSTYTLTMTLQFAFALHST